MNPRKPARPRRPPPPANAPGVTEVPEVVDAVPGVRGKPGRPRRRPGELYGDRAYGSAPHRGPLRERGIRPQQARRGGGHGSGRGKVGRVVERFSGWLHGFRKLRLRADWALQTPDALLRLGCSLICLRVSLNPETG